MKRQPHQDDALVVAGVETTPFHELPYRTSGARQPQRCRLPFHRAYAKGMPPGIQSLVFTSDLQGREIGGANRLLGEVVADELNALVEAGETPQPGAIFVCGDLYDYPDCHKRGGSGPVDSVFEALTKSGARVVGVLGNHDELTDPQRLPNAVTLLDGDVVEHICGLTVGGVSGIVGDPNRSQRRSAESFLEVMERVTDQKPDILLLHQGPTDPDRPDRRGDPDLELSLRSGFEGLTVFGHTKWEDPWLIPLGEGQALNVDGRVVVVVPAQSGH
ncbi:metallophosphoesterase family protein [Marinobacter sp. C2H3]|uniref:metallophosphoesterase family protein n=1 Tax=Marinobacter sp. C2H3 TaxID=3119003 RepID=UPI00300EA26B